MKNRRLWTACLMIGLGLITVAPAQAQVHLSGLISDYTPASGVSGPWEMRGEWNVSINVKSGTANFSATVNMTHSDYWVVLNPSLADDNTAAGRHPHTHLITLTHATVTPLATGGFELTGPVYVTNDGNPAPFMSKCSAAAPCTLTVDFTGGTVLQLSNLGMTFGGPPTGHFGTQAIHGVVRRAD